MVDHSTFGKPGVLLVEIVFPPSGKSVLVISSFLSLSKILPFCLPCLCLLSSPVGIPFCFVCCFFQGGGLHKSILTFWKFCASKFLFFYHSLSPCCLFVSLSYFLLCFNLHGPFSFLFSSKSFYFFLIPLFVILVQVMIIVVIGVSQAVSKFLTFTIVCWKPAA